MDLLKQIKELEKTAKEAEKNKQEIEFTKNKLEDLKKEIKPIRDELQNSINKLNVWLGEIKISKTYNKRGKELTKILNNITEQLYIKMKVDEAEIGTTEIEKALEEENISKTNKSYAVSIRNDLRKLPSVSERKDKRKVVLFFNGSEIDKKGQEQLLQKFGKNIIKDEKKSDINFEKVSFMR